MKTTQAEHTLNRRSPGRPRGSGGEEKVLLGLYVPKSLWLKVAEAAKKERRSLSSQGVCILEDWERSQAQN
jgi:hypothetical protein